MPKQPLTRQRRLANERALYRYQQALVRGDIETIATILQAASQDAELEQMLYILHNSEQLEEPLPITIYPHQQDQHPKFTSFPLLRLHSRTKHPVRQQHAHPRLQTLVAVLMVLALLVSFTALYSNAALPIATQTVATSQGMVILLFADGHIQAVRGVTGQSVWSYATGLTIDQSVNNRLSVQNHVVYVMATNNLVTAVNHLYALNEETGNLLWQKILPVQLANSIPNTSRLNVDAGIIYMSIQGNTQNVLYALAADDGHLLWQAANGISSNAPFLTANSGIAYLALQNTTSSQATIEARRGSNGSILWKYQITGDTWLATVTNQVLYVAYAYSSFVSPLDTKSNQHLLALQVSNGGLIWSQYLSFDNPLTGLAYGQGTLVIGAIPQLCAYSASNGDMFWCNGASNNSSPSVVSSVGRYLPGPDKLYTAYATTQSGVLIQALNFQTAQPLWGNAFAYSKSEYPFLPFSFVQLQQNTLLVGGGSPLVTALDANNGHVLWHINGSAPPAVVQVVATAS